MDFPPVIITGVYGSGKTEFCVNYALRMSALYPGRKVLLADLDVINPYFRSREKSAFLSSRNVEIIGSILVDADNADLPAISGQVLRAVLAGENLIVDLAGSSNGLKALTYFKEQLGSYELWVVLNAFREESSTAAKALAFINEARTVSGLKVTGLVHNSHLLHDTTASDVMYGQELALQVSAAANIPVVYTFLQTAVYNELGKRIRSPVMTFDKLIMRDEWL